MAKRDDDLLRLMREQFDGSKDFDNECRRMALDDVKFAFVPGNQWDTELKRKRRNRPSYEFNKIRQHIRQVTGDQRQNRPGIKVRAAEGGDADLAELMQGLIRSIERKSNADQAYDTAFEFAVSGGFGAIRLCTEYATQDDFDLDVKIQEVRNPFCVYFDPAAREFDRRDSNFCFVTEQISRAEFKRRYPKADATSIDGGVGDQRLNTWFGEDAVQIAEYWTRKPIKKRIVQLSTGEVVDGSEWDKVADELSQPEFAIDPMTGQPALDPQTGQPSVLREPVTAVREREVDDYRVEMRIVSGDAVLAGPYEWPGKFIPIIPVWGDITQVEGKDYYSGMVRFARDAQTTYNFHRSVMIEAVANAPKAPFMATPKQIEGFERIWRDMGSENFPYIPYNPDPQAGGIPQRSQGPDIPSAMVQMAALDSEDLKAVTGQFDASLGARSNESSGRAILARQREGDIATYSYIDNLSRAIRFIGEQLVDIIPKVYDTERVVKVLDMEDNEDDVVINRTVMDMQTGEAVLLNDLSAGKYSVAVTVGPSYSTQRMETAEAMLQLSQNPLLGPIATYLALKNMDIPGAEEAIDAMRRMLIQQGMIEPNEEEQAAMSQPNPDQEMAKQMQAALAQAEVQLKTAQAIKANADADKAQAESFATMQTLPSDIELAQMRAINEAQNAGLRVGLIMPK